MFDADFVQELRAVVQAIDTAPALALQGLRRLALGLANRVCRDCGHARDFENLSDAITYAAGSLPQMTKVQLDYVSRLSNKVSHNVEGILVRKVDADSSLGAFVSALEWFLHDYSRGPRLSRPLGEYDDRLLAEAYLKEIARGAEEDPLGTLLRRRLLVRDVFQEPLVAASLDPPQVDVPMHPTEDDRLYDEIIDLERALDSGACVPWSVARNAAASWVVLAPSGSGKSLLLQWESLVALDVFLSGEATPVIPVRWAAASLAAELAGRATLHGVLSQRTMELLRSVVPPATPDDALRRFAERAWREGWYRLLLDGLEGIAEEARHRFLENLLTQAKDHASAIVTGRPVDPRALPTGSVPVAYLVSPFRDRPDSRASVRIQRFCEAWLGTPDEARRLVEMLEDSRGLREMAETPFILALICWQFHTGRLVPHGERLDLYRAVLDALLSRASDRSRDAAFGARKRPALRAVAWTALEQQQPLNQLQAIAAIKQATALETTTGEAERLLRELTEIDCILRISGERVEFFHPSIAEYLAAEWAAGDDALTSAVVSSAHDAHWQGTVAFLAGLAPRPEAILSSLSKARLTPSVRARVMSACLVESHRRVASENLAAFALQVAHEAQLAVKLPWRNLAPHRVVRHALAELSTRSASVEAVAGALDLVRARNVQAQAEARKPIVDEPLSEAKSAARGALSHELAFVRWIGAWLCGVLRDWAAVKDLTDRLRDSESSVRGVAAWALAHVRSPDGGLAIDAATQLRSALADEEPSVIRLAASSLAWLEDEPSASVLFSVAKAAEDVSVATSAVYGLSRLASAGKLRGVDVRTVAAWLRDALSRDEELARTAASALGHLARRYHAIDAETVDRIATMLRSGKRATRRAAAYALKDLAEGRHVDLVLEVLQHERDPAVLVALCKAIGRLKLAAAYDRMGELLLSNHGGVQAVALEALIALDSRRAASTCIDVIVGENRPQLDALARLFLRNKTLTNGDLKQATTDERYQAVVSLLRSARRPLLLQAGCRVVAAKPSGGGAEVVASLLFHDNVGVLSSACRVLEHFRYPQVLPRLRDLVNDLGQHPIVLASACGALGFHRDDGAANACLRLLQHESYKVRASACGYFAKVESEEALSLCVSMVKDPNQEPEVRASALRVFIENWDRRGLAAAVAVLTAPDTGEIKVLGNACRVIARYGRVLRGRARQKAETALRQLAAASHPALRKSVEAALLAVACSARRTQPGQRTVRADS